MDLELGLRRLAPLADFDVAIADSGIDRAQLDEIGGSGVSLGVGAGVGPETLPRKGSYSTLQRE